MPEVAFHTGLSDPLAYACRLLRKAWRQGARVVVAGEPAQLGRLDVQLWTFEHEEFVPHARLKAGERVGLALQRTPIWLADDPAQAPAEATVLVNLGPGMSTGYDRFARVIELVGSDPDALQAGRRRWRDYQAAGLTPHKHEMDAPAQPVTRGAGA